MNNPISTIRSEAFAALNVRGIYLGPNSIAVAESGSFSDIESCDYLSLPVATTGNYPKDMIKNSFIATIQLAINSSGNPINFDRCFVGAPVLCPNVKLSIDGFCNDIMNELHNCPDASRIQIESNLARILCEADPSFPKFCYVNLGALKSTAVFSSYSIVSNYREVCFDGSQLMTTSFFLNQTFACENSLLSIANIARIVTIAPSLGPSTFKSIPKVFLQFTKLSVLQIDRGTVNCTCALAKYFHDFANHVQLIGFCDNGQTIDSWINANYDGCKDTTDQLPEYNTAMCQEKCTQSKAIF